MGPHIFAKNVPCIASRKILTRVLFILGCLGAKGYVIFHLSILRELEVGVYIETSDKAAGELAHSRKRAICVERKN